MKLHFYGSGASEGFPAMFCDCRWCEEARRLGGKNLRTRTSCGIDETLLIDFSADTYAHVLYGGLDMRRIHHVLFTHSHGDHMYPTDLMTILPPMAWRKRKEPLALYGTEGCKAKMTEAIGSRAGTEEHLYFEALPLWETTTIDSYRVTPLEANHDPKETCFIYAIECAGKTLLYAHDTAMFKARTWQALSRSRFDCVVLDCTSVTEPRVFSNHMGFDENVLIRQRMLEEGMADGSTVFVASHFAHTYGPLHDRLTDVFEKEGFIPAYDGMELVF